MPSYFRFQVISEKLFDKLQTHSDVILVGSSGTMTPILQRLQITELASEPSSCGSRQRWHWQEKYHCDCNSCCRRIVPSCGVVYLEMHRKLNEKATLWRGFLFFWIEMHQKVDVHFRMLIKERLNLKQSNLNGLFEGYIFKKNINKYCILTNKNLVIF